jgi:hypothetical protein
VQVSGWLQATVAARHQVFLYRERSVTTVWYGIVIQNKLARQRMNASEYMDDWAGGQQEFESILRHCSLGYSMRSKIDKGPAFPCCLLLAAVLSDELSWGLSKSTSLGTGFKSVGAFARMYRKCACLH